jgi:glutaminyl-tRNA synthetase
MIEDDRTQGKNKGWVITRFPPEPNGFLHIGHAKSICLNFGLAQHYGAMDSKARCHLRFDDTNPVKEDEVYIRSIKEDVSWLGFSWGDHLYHASDYFDRLFELACVLIQKGKAYVCSLKAEEVKAYRGTLTEGGQESPYRNRSVEENLELFQKMKDGVFPDGAHVLRAKIHMGSGNINMRDPAIYRIKHANHPMTGDKWCIYPMYDFAHGISDALEGITHSLCTLEFEDHRPLYNWFLDELPPLGAYPQQIEFARLELTSTVTSKRKLKELVDRGIVAGWDDPRLPTLAGLRRRGFLPEAIRMFCDRIGVSKKQTVIRYEILEDCLREAWNTKAKRALGVLSPLKVVITNYPEDLSSIQMLEAPNHPQDPSQGYREVPFSSELYIEASDFMEAPPKDFFRLAPGREVRLRYGYIILCEEVIRDPKTREILELRCRMDRDTLGKKPEGRKVKGIIHWVCAKSALPVEVRLYEKLFLQDDPGALGDQWLEGINPNSLKIQTAWVEPSLGTAAPEEGFQWERLGYFVSDRYDKGVFHRACDLRDHRGL